MDMSASIAPKSDQLDAIELAAGPRTFTIAEVTKHNVEQPWNLHLAEFPRPWRPSKSMLRVMAAAWGLDGAKWAGNRVTLFCDPTVQFGNETVGGTRISHMSGIDKALKLPLLVKRGKSALFTVQPLPAEAPAPARDFLVESEAIGPNQEKLRALWIEARDAGEPQYILDSIKEAATMTPADES